MKASAINDEQMRTIIQHADVSFIAVLSQNANPSEPVGGVSMLSLATKDRRIDIIMVRLESGPVESGPISGGRLMRAVSMNNFVPLRTALFGNTWRDFFEIDESLILAARLRHHQISFDVANDGAVTTYKSESALNIMLARDEINPEFVMTELK